MTDRAKDPPLMTKEQLVAYLAGYEAVNALEIEELRNMSIETKFKHAAALMETASRMGWNKALAAEEADVRELWIRLKRAYSGDK